MWRPVDEPWQYRVLNALPAGVDRSQIVRAMQLTYQQRLDAMTELLRLAHELAPGAVTKFDELFRALVAGGVELVVIGGLAVIRHGFVRATLALDICYARSPENLRRIVAALGSHSPRLRGAPAELPFFWDEQTLRNGLNFTLTTALGDIDLLGEVTGVGGYGELSLRADEQDVFGHRIKIMSVDDLIRSKAAAGRAKDLIDLEALRKR